MKQPRLPRPNSLNCSAAATNSGQGVVDSSAATLVGLVDWSTTGASAERGEPLLEGAVRA